MTTTKVSSANPSPSGTTLTISNVSAGGITTTGATLSWTTSQAGTSQVEYGTTTSYGTMAALDPTRVTSHAQSLSGLNAGTTYHYRVHSKDANNNDVVSGDFNFTTTTAGSTLTISNVTASGITSSGATITWTTNTGATSQVEYGFTTAYGSSTPLDNTLVTSHSQTISGLTASTTYHYRVHSKVGSGNDVASGDNTFTTAPAGSGGAAGSPVLSFSDLTSGPNTGNTDTSKGQTSGADGAIVSVWGLDLGASQGSSSLSVNGAVAKTIYYWGNAVRPWSPANLNNGYQNMQMVIFQVPSTAASGAGTISVTVNGVTSNTVPFTVTSGRIFFVCGTPASGQSSCSNSNAGTWQSPFGTIVAGRNAATQARDIVYVENGSPEGSDSNCVGVATLCIYTDGVSLIGYPGAINQIGTTGEPNCGNNGGTGIALSNSSGSVHASNVTVAKFDLRGGLEAIDSRGDNERWVGSSVSVPNLNSDTGGVYINGSNIYLLGLETFNVGLLCQTEGGPGLCGGTAPDGANCGTNADNRTFAHVYYITGRRGQATAAVESNRHIEWNYIHDNLNGASMAFNIFQSNEGGSGGVPDIVKDFVIAHNVVKDQYHNGMQFSGIDGNNYIYDNLFINTGQGTGLTGVDSYNPGYGMGMRLGGGPNGPNTFHVYNNTIYKSGCGKVNGYWCGNPTITSNSIYGSIIFEGSAGNPIIDMHNNIMAQTDPTIHYYGSTGYAVIPSGAGQSSNNLWFGAGAAPSWDVNAVNLDPQFVSAGSNFRLQSTSPAINAGSSLGAAFVTSDLDGNPQPTNGAFDLGAYEFP